MNKAALNFWLQRGFQPPKELREVPRNPPGKAFAPVPKEPEKPCMSYVQRLEITKEQHIAAIQHFHREHGHPPDEYSPGDASKYYKLPISWYAAIGSMGLRTGRGSEQRMSIPLSPYKVLLAELGMLAFYPPTTEDQDRKAVQDYFNKHKRCPTAETGDASEFYGFPIKWSVINCRLIARKSTLSKLCIEMGISTVRFPTTSDQQNQGAIQRYFAKFGQPPSSKGGDASDFYGFSITWKIVHLRLQRAGSSLPLLCRQLEAQGLVHTTNG